MTIDEAYKILGLHFGANENDIDTNYKKLVKVHHPDIGGNNAKMAELNTARDLAMSLINNKDIYALAIRQVKDLIVTERELQDAKEEYKSEAQSLYKKLDRRKGTYKTLKAMTILLGVLAGIFLVLGTNILPVYQQEVGQEASKLMTKWILLYGGAIALVYLMFTYMESQMKEKIEEFKDNLDNKKTIAKLLYEILYLHKDKQDKPEMEFTETRFERDVNNWLDDRYSNNPYREVKQLIFATPVRYSLRSVARQMGEEDFTKLVLLKGQEKELLEEIEIDIAKDEAKYRITAEMEKLKNNRNKHDRRNDY